MNNPYGDPYIWSISDGGEIVGFVTGGPGKFEAIKYRRPERGRSSRISEAVMELFRALHDDAVIVRVSPDVSYVGAPGKALLEEEWR